MKIDLEKIKNKLAQLKASGQGGSSYKTHTWKPPAPDEMAQIRMLANPHNEPGDPFSELWFHYDLSQFPVVCVDKSHGKTCLLCECGKQLAKSDKAQDKEMAKKFFPRNRYFAVVVDRADPELKPKYWQFGPQIYEELLTKLLDSEYAHYLDVDNGIDMEVRTIKQPKKKFAEQKISFRRKETKLTDSKKKIEEILNAVKPLAEVHPASTNAKLKEVLDKFIEVNTKDPESEKEDDDNKEEKDSDRTIGGNTPDASEGPDGMSDSDDIDEKFNDILGD